MSMVSSVELLKCIKCPFVGNYECSIDSTLDLGRVYDDEKVHPDCPLLDGRVIVVKAVDGNLIIGVDYQ